VSRIGEQPRPRIGVLIGGGNAAYRFAADDAHMLAAELACNAAASGASLLVTTSRRTGTENLEILRAALADTRTFLWDGTGDNPYYGILGLADVLVVTADSVNMITEAVATAGPSISTACRRFREIRALPRGASHCGVIGAVLSGIARKFSRPIISTRCPASSAPSVKSHRAFFEQIED